VISFVSAEETNNCNEIKEYLENKSLNYTKTIEKCIMDSNGNVNELKVLNEDLQEEDVNKILSYDTIKYLEYVVVFILSDEEDSSYSYRLKPHPGYSKFPSIISNLSELEILNFNYNNFRFIKYSPDIKQTSVEDGSFNLSKTLKKLTLSQVNLSNNNLKELSKLTNLEEITLNYCTFGEDGFSSFENHENITQLSINYYLGDEKVIPNNIGKIKSLKKLFIKNGYCKEKSYDFNGLDNIEIIYVEISNACNFDLSKLDKLSELSVLGPNDFLFGTGLTTPLDLKFPNSVKKLKLTELTFTSDNYKAVASLPNIEELTLILNVIPNDIPNAINVFFLVRNV